MSKDDLITWGPEKPEELWGDEARSISDDDLYSWNIQQKEIADALRERAQSGEQNPIDKLNAEQIRELYEKSQAAHAQREAATRQEEAVRQFVVECPELVLNPRNTARIDAYLQAASLDATDPDHFHQAYKALSARKLLQIDESKRPRAPRKRLTQADLETMPLDELRELAEAQARK